MTKFYINRDIVEGPGGGGYKMFNELHRSFDTVITPENADVIFITGLCSEGRHADARTLVKNKKLGQKIVLRVNDNDARKGTTYVDKELIELSKHVDLTIFVSNWQKNYFREWHCVNNVVIINGVDKQIFKPNTRLNNGKINIVTAHWSNNRLKGSDYVEFLDDFVSKNSNDFTYTYIGRTDVNLKHSKHIKPLAAKELGEELGKYDVCINASRWDPGPNSVVEMISCDVPTYCHFDGGGGREFADEEHVFSTFEDVEKLLLLKKITQNSWIPNDWKTCISEYIRVLNENL